jgi:hypothetical protein
MIEIEEKELMRAGKEGMDEFIQLFVDRYKEELGGELTADNMNRLTADQHTLYAYSVLHEELMVGGFCQLIQNGYGGYIFGNPFAKALRLWGAEELSKLLYKAKKIYDEHRTDLERERDDDEFMAMYEQYEEFDDLEEHFFDIEEETAAIVAQYVDDHIELFATVVK